MGDDGHAMVASDGVRGEGGTHSVDAGRKAHRSPRLGLAGPGRGRTELEDTRRGYPGSNFHE